MMGNEFIGRLGGGDKHLLAHSPPGMMRIMGENIIQRLLGPFPYRPERKAGALHQLSITSIGGDDHLMATSSQSFSDCKERHQISDRSQSYGQELHSL